MLDNDKPVSPAGGPSPAKDAEWSSLLREVLRSASLLRDVLGYALPGGLAVLFVVHAFGPARLLPLRASAPLWLLAPTLIAIAYAAGQARS